MARSAPTPPHSAAPDGRRVLVHPLPRPARRIALFGGIYSNHLALAAAIDDAKRRGADAMFCLGDLGAFGPHPDLVFPLLAQGGVATLAGNYDDALAKGLGDCQCGYTDPRDNHFARLSYAYTFARTSASNKEWMATLPSLVRLEFGGHAALLCHGSPRRQNEFLWESTTPDHFLEMLCDEHEVELIACTHSGIKWSRRLPSGRLVVNAGVLGRPENDGTARVWYAVLDAKAPGADASNSQRGAADDIEVTFVPLTYDHERLASEMRDEKLPEEFVATVLTGWWTTCLEVLPAKERRRGKF